MAGRPTHISLMASSRKHEVTHDTSSKELDGNCNLFTSIVVRNTTAPNLLLQFGAGKKVHNTE